MTPSKIKAMQTALLKYNAAARQLLAEDEFPGEFVEGLAECLKRGEEALKVEVKGRS